MTTLQIGITGGIGSGKSLIARIFSLLSIPIYDADTVAKMLMATDKELIASIKQSFGEAAYHKNGALNRPYLAQNVFNKSENVNLLNSMVHPRVGLHYKAWVKQHAPSPYIIKEAALLFESGSYKQLDKIIAVFAPEEVRITRTLKRDPQRSRDQVLAIIDKQMNEGEKMGKADFVVYNDDSQLVIPQVLALDKLFRNRA